VSSKILVSTGNLCRLMYQTIKLIAFFPSTILHDFHSACGTKKKKKAKQNTCVSRNFSTKLRQCIFVSVKKSFVSTATALSDENNKCQSVGVELFVRLLSYLALRVFQSASPLQTSPILAVSNGDRTPPRPIKISFAALFAQPR